MRNVNKGVKEFKNKLVARLMSIRIKKHLMNAKDNRIKFSVIVSNFCSTANFFVNADNSEC